MKRLMERLRKTARRMHAEQESGVAMTEFAIAFPLQFFLTLAVMQFSLLLIGHVLVEQAAFSAARAALVADVPPDGAASWNAAQVQNAKQVEAERAACFLLQPVCPPNSEVPGASADPTNAIKFMTDDRSAAAKALTRVQIVEDSQHPEFIGAYVEHDLVLIIPVVNHWFAKLGGGNPGEFWYGPNTQGASTYNAASQTHKITCYTLKHSAFLPRTWRPQ